VQQAVPVHLRWEALALVALGGAIGTGAREALALTWPAPPDGVPWTIAAINVGGAFVLGVLLEALARRGPDEGRRRALRLFAGTGVLGGFTTYSALAVDTALLGGDHLTLAVAYALGSVAAGAAAAAAGIVVAARVLPGRSVAAGAGDADRRGGDEPGGAAADGRGGDER